MQAGFVLWLLKSFVLHSSNLFPLLLSLKCHQEPISFCIRRCQLDVAQGQAC